MQPNTGLLAGLVACMVLALLFGVMYFHASAETDRLHNTLGSGSVEVFVDDPYVNRYVDAVKQERDRLARAAIARDEEITARKREIDRLKSLQEEEQIRVRDRDAEIAGRDAELAAEKKAHRATADKAKSTRTAMENELKKDQEGYRKLHLEAEATAQKRLEENRQIVERNDIQLKNLRMQVGNLESQREELQRQISRYTGNDTAGVAVGGRKEYAGAVLEVDLQRRIVMVDVGRFHNVRVGMRFDVMRKRGNTEVSLGMVELVRVDEMVSEGVILEKMTAVKVDPQTTWRTDDPYMLYSPLVLTWEKDPNDPTKLLRADLPPTKPLPLVAERYEPKSTMDPLNPIQKGDRLFNPMFNARQPLKIAVLGRPYIGGNEFGEVEAFGKYIRRLRPVEPDRIVRAIENSGAEAIRPVVEESEDGDGLKAEPDRLTPEVAFVILGRIVPPVPVSDEDRKNLTDDDLKTLADEFAKATVRYQAESAMRDQARAYGIPVLWEIDIVRFFE